MGLLNDLVGELFNLFSVNVTKLKTYQSSHMRAVQSISNKVSQNQILNLSNVKIYVQGTHIKGDIVIGQKGKMINVSGYINNYAQMDIEEKLNQLIKLKESDNPSVAALIGVIGVNVTNIDQTQEASMEIIQQIKNECTQDQLFNLEDIYVGLYDSVVDGSILISQEAFHEGNQESSGCAIENVAGIVALIDMAIDDEIIIGSKINWGMIFAIAGVALFVLIVTPIVIKLVKDKKKKGDKISSSK